MPALCVWAGDDGPGIREAVATLGLEYRTGAHAEPRAGPELRSGRLHHIEVDRAVDAGDPRPAADLPEQPVAGRTPDQLTGPRRLVDGAGGDVVLLVEVVEDVDGDTPARRRLDAIDERLQLADDVAAGTQPVTPFEPRPVARQPPEPAGPRRAAPTP